MNPRRFASFASSVLMFALGLPVAFLSLQGCAEGETDPFGNGGSGGSGGGEGGAGGGEQTGGSGGMGGGASSSSSSASSASSSSSSSASSASSSSSSSSSSGAGGSGGGFIPPTGTADYPAESEANDIPALSDSLAMGTKGFTASIYPLGDIDVFEVDVTIPGSTLTVNISDGMSGCPSTAVAVRIDGPNGAVASDSGTCVQMSPLMIPELANLALGKNYVQIESTSFSTEPVYVAELLLQPPFCGNGIAQGVEQCDDGNMVAGDGCAADCKLEGVYLTELEPNQPANKANTLNGADGIFAALQPVGDQDYFTFDVTVPGSSVTLEVSDGFGGCPSGFDSVLYLYSGTNTLLVSDDEDGVSSCSMISPATDLEATNLGVGKYTVMVEDFLNNDAQASYVLKIKVSAPGCGDGILSGGEQCDDGDLMAGDGCDAMCMAESPWEIESNNTRMTATALWAGTTVFHASINPVGDVDYFVFTLPAGMKPSLLTHMIGNVSNCNDDTKMDLLDSNGTVIASDDDDGPGTCSKIDGVGDPAVNNLPAGTYYVRVNDFGDNDAIPSYQLDVVFQ